MFNPQGGEIRLAHFFLKIMSYKKTQLHRNPTEQGESIEEMLRRLSANKEPIPDNVPPIYTPDADGVIPDYDIRTDRQEVAIEAQDKYARSNLAKSAEKPAQPQNEGKEE